ncbi:MAG: flavodoxin family protein [Armatimonadetes bacterium]|nr:flavodoxin family protein [Armatimonadota bacterium]
MSNITIAFHSGYGHTKKVAEAVAAGVESVAGTTVHLLDVTKVDEPLDGFASGWDALDASEGIIFGSPTYMGGPSGPFKTFADSTVSRWVGGAWQDKLAAGFSNSGSNYGDKGLTLYYFVTLASQHGMNWVSKALKNDGVTNRNGFSVGLGVQSDNDSPEVTPGEADLNTSKKFGARFAEAVARWNK